VSTTSHPFYDEGNAVTAFQPHFLELKEEKAVYYFSGAVEQQILVEAHNYFKKFPDGQRLFTIFNEFAQNVAYHSVEKNLRNGSLSAEGVGKLIVAEGKAGFRFASTNQVSAHQVELIDKKVEQINASARQELKKMRSSLIKKPRTPGQRGGKMGLVQVAILTQQPLVCLHKPLTEHISLMLLETVLPYRS
jgi:hypothetical protein